MPTSSITSLVYIDSTGYHYSDYPSFLSWLTSQYQAIYGLDVYIDPDSMDGQFLAVLAQAFYDTAALGSAVYASFSPLTAQGYGLARVVKINGLNKLVASHSTVTLAIGGVSGTVITNGIAQDALDQQWILPATVTIPGGGTVNVVATASTLGAVQAAANTINTIFTPTNGWQTVNNAAAASAGDPVESDAQLRIRQSVSTSIPALTPLDATVGALSNLVGTQENGVVGYENDTATNDAVTGIPAHTVCFVVASSASQTDICQTIQLYKTPGVGTFGAVTQTVFDSQGMPIPISYQPVVPTRVYVTVNLSTTTGWSTNSIAIIQAAVQAAIKNLPIGCNAEIGQDGVFYYTTLYPVVYSSVPGQTFDINSILVGLSSGGQSANNITSILFDAQLFVQALADVTVNA